MKCVAYLLYKKRWFQRTAHTSKFQIHKKTDDQVTRVQCSGHDRGVAFTQATLSPALWSWCPVLIWYLESKEIISYDELYTQHWINLITNSWLCGRAISLCSKHPPPLRILVGGDIPSWLRARHVTIKKYLQWVLWNLEMNVPLTDAQRSREQRPTVLLQTQYSPRISWVISVSTSIDNKQTQTIKCQDHPPLLRENRGAVFLFHRRSLTVWRDGSLADSGRLVAFLDCCLPVTQPVICVLIVKLKKARRKANAYNARFQFKLG